MKKFTFFLMAALFCGSLSTFAQDDEISVTPAIDEDTFEPTFKFNKDYTYYGIYLDDETKEVNLADDQYIYIGPDEKNGRVLDVWGDGLSLTFGTPSGTNSFGIPDSYNTVTVGSLGWSGLGYRVEDNNTINLSGVNQNYTLHLALKSTSTASCDIIVYNGDKEAHLVFGESDYGDNEPVADFPRDGEWYNIDIPMEYIKDLAGIDYKNANAYSGTYLAIMPGTTQGVTLDFDAIFFYGPKDTNTAINGITVDKGNTTAEFYTIDGKKVSAANAKANKGIYIVKSNDNAKKVVF